ncbi:MAG TPA: ABC transporter permease [Terriglobia bacterium]|nr:ABC transporter permease [Terriglobia bacterium]
MSKRIVSLFRNLLRKRAFEQALEDELQSSVEVLTQEKMKEGFSQSAARREALIELGGVEQVKEEVRAARAGRILEDFARDIRFGFRALAKSPGFAAVAILTLALGIAANSTIFSWINSTILNPIPGISHTSDLVTVMRGERSEHPTPPFSYLDYRDLRDNNRSLSGLLGFHHDFMYLTGNGEPARLWGALTSANYFDVLGVRPILGRGFSPEEEQKPGSVVVISYGLWQSHFGADRSVVGKTIAIDLHPYTIIGVTPPGFQGCFTGLRTDLWIPLMLDREVWGSNRPADRGAFWLNVYGRLKPGVSPQQAEGDLNQLMERIAEAYPEAHQGSPNQISLDPLWRSPFGTNVYLYKTLPLLQGLALVLMLLACANVANLLLVRSMGRRREIAIRLAVGAGRGQVVRQLLVESLLLALAGGGIAMLMMTWTAGTLAHFDPATPLPLSLNGRADLRVLLITLGFSLLTALLFGTLPAWRTSSINPVAVIKEEAGSISGGLHKSRLAGGLVVGQISLSLLLLICAGLFIRSLDMERRSDIGFDPNRVVLASYVPLPDHLKFGRDLLAKLESTPGVESATLADFSPLNFTVHTDFIEVGGYVPQPHESMEISLGVVGPKYFSMMKTGLISGRDFTDHDGPGAQLVAIVNQAFVDRFWPGQDALGKRICRSGRWFTVVGVARNAKYRRLIYGPEPVFYLPLFQDDRTPVIVHVRVSGDPRSFQLQVAEAIRAVDAGSPRSSAFGSTSSPVFDVTTLEDSMQLGDIFERFAATFAGSFGFLALALATVGIYGVVAYATRQRTREIAIRMALGAKRGDVLGLVVAQGLRLTLAGLGVGLVASVALTRFLRGQLFGVTSTDPPTFIAVSLILTSVALLASYIPARRAAKVDPIVALRYE